MSHVWNRKKTVLISDLHSHLQDLSWYQVQKLAGKRLFCSTTTHITGQQGLGGKGSLGWWVGGPDDAG